METVELEAEIEVGLHEECMEGRKGYGTGIRPNHWIPSRAYTFIGQIDFLDRDWLEPGESCKARLRFIVPKQDVPKFVAGFSWHICEVNRIMGYCTVVTLSAN
jgi:hypothetical protein